jgi:hypothetical protein
VDPIRNPYSPGAGTPPPELAGRTKLLENVRISWRRLKVGNPAKSVLLVGLRGVGKTVLLDQMRNDAEADGVHTVRTETPEGRSLPGVLAPQLRLALLRLSNAEHAKAIALRALRGLAGFVKGLKAKFGDIEVGLDMEPEVGLADNGDLELDLTALLEVVGRAAKAANTALLIFIDELQYIKEDGFAALISALHRCAQQKLPVSVIGAGLPHLRGQAGKAKSYAERLFDFPDVGALSQDAAKRALMKPANDLGVDFSPEALDEIIAQTHSYAYFIQEWGKQAWNTATVSPITVADVRAAATQAIAALDEGFFRVRFDRLTPMEKRYLRAMAALGAGPHRSGDVADSFGRSVNKLAPLRNGIIGKGMIWSPNHGDTAFTVPLFDEFMQRIMPGDEWRLTN